MSFILDPWPWYISGSLIAINMLVLLLLGKSFGVSSTLRSLCAMGGAGNFSSFFKIDWRKDKWNLIFVLGSMVGGFIAVQFLSTDAGLNLSDSTISDLDALGVEFSGGLAPLSLFSFQSLLTFKGWLFIVFGGFLVGFGARWAGGCTSGHAISGLSNFQFPSLVAVIGFFLGGLLITHLVFPLIF